MLLRLFASMESKLRASTEKTDYGVLVKLSKDNVGLVKLGGPILGRTRAENTLSFLKAPLTLSCRSWLGLQ